MPTADISPSMQDIIKAPPLRFWQTLWKTGEEAREFADALAVEVLKGIQSLRDRMQVTVTPEIIDGVRVHVIMPKTIPPKNRRQGADPHARRLLRAFPRRIRYPRGS